ncbi:MAG: hypothetical protein V3T17_04255 [Pseudomonadales bacterium]
MSSHRKLLVLDVDNTLVHTVLLTGLSDYEAGLYRDLLLRTFPDSSCFRDEDRAVIVPRPNLSIFLEFA